MSAPTVERIAGRRVGLLRRGPDPAVARSVAICLHGFPDEAGSFEAVLEGLAAAGHCAVAPCLRGFAPTEVPPDGDVTLRRLAEDVVALLDHLGAPTAALIGHDWGSLVAHCAAVGFPDRVSRLALLSVPPARVFARNLPRNPDQLVRSRYMAEFQLRGPSDRRARRDDLALVERLWRRWSPGYAPPPERLAAVRAALEPPGALETALDYYRGLRSPRNWRRSARLAFGRPVQPALVLVGQNDACIAPALFDGLAGAFLGDFDLQVLPNAGHFLPCEAPQAVLDVLLPFLEPR